LHSSQFLFDPAVFVRFLMNLSLIYLSFCFIPFFSFSILFKGTKESGSSHQSIFLPGLSSLSPFIFFRID
jgi:hypothetical protein